MDTLSNCQFNRQPSQGGFLSKKGLLPDFRILLFFPLIFLLGFFGGSEALGQTGVVTPTTAFDIDPNNPPACPQNNLRISAVDFRDPNTGDRFDPNDLAGTVIGTPIVGEVWATFIVSGNGYNFHAQYDLIIDGISQGQQALCIVVEDANGNTINITDGLQIKISDFTWNYGSKVEIKNVYQTWITGNAKADVKTCPSTAGNSQCDYVGEGFVVETPVVANFEFNTFCENFDVSFTNLSNGGDENVAFSYLWDFGDGNTSTAENPTHTYANAGTYSVTLTSTKGVDSDDIVLDVTVNDPIVLTINSPPAVCEPLTVDITAAAVTNGSSAGLEFTYWEDEFAQNTLSNPSAISVSGDYWIKGTDPATNCELIKKVTVVINDAPDAPVSGGDQFECFDEGVSLIPTATAPNGSSVVWYEVPANGNPVLSPSWSTVGQKTFYAASVDDITGCESLTRTPVTLTIGTCSLTISKDVDQASIDAPTTLNYTIVVDNTGNTDLTGVVVTDPFAGGATLTSGDANNN
ncbi:PKD domain-containing protein, partial [Algoriphagus namhaensis]